MRRTRFLAASGMLAATGLFAPAASARAVVAGAPSDTEYDLETRGGTLSGTSLMPAGPAPVPVVLIIPGSGPTDRDGNGPNLQLNMYRKLANALAEQGVATVRYDKRGIGASRAALASESDIRFDTGVDDAAAWIEKLHGDPRFSRVVIAGHSEGSLVGMLAAQHAETGAYVSIEGAGFPAADILRAQLKPKLAGYPQLAAQADTILDSLARGKRVPEADVPPALAALFRPSVQPYLISWFRYDPRVEIAKLPGRVTIVQGTHDVQVPVEDGRALADAAPQAAYVVIDGMTHVLTDDPGTTLAEQTQGAYADAGRPINPTLVTTIASAATQL